MKYVIFDCDNTFGIEDCDVDDGLALLYLLGCSQVCLLGITTTYGNSRADIVYENTRRMLKEIGREDIPVKKGGETKEDYESEAACYLAEMAEKYQDQLTILATGSLTNLQGAFKKAPDFFDKVGEIVLMGGITEPLIFHKKRMDELNFSCDAEASYTVLTKGKKVSVITGNNCLKVLFTKEEYRAVLYGSDKKIAQYIREKTEYWFGYNKEEYGIQGFYNWDVTAAVYVVHPELFQDCTGTYRLSVSELESGYLHPALGQEANADLNLPEIRGEEAFKKTIYDTWMKVPLFNEDSQLK